MKKKVTSFVALMGICGCMAFSSGLADGKVWLGISYLASKRGASAEANLAIGAIGLIDAAAWGFGVGIVAGPVGGAVAGVVAGA
jgi:hypothetical protein